MRPRYTLVADWARVVQDPAPAAGMATADHSGNCCAGAVCADGAAAEVALAGNALPAMECEYPQTFVNTEYDLQNSRLSKRHR